MIDWTTIKPLLATLIADRSDLQALWMDQKRPALDPTKLAWCLLVVSAVEGYGVDDKTQRYDASKASTCSTVPLLCTLTAGTTLVAGTHFAEDVSGVRWTPVANYTAGASGLQSVPFRAEFPGPFVADIGDIDSIDTAPTTGWTACTNAVAATPGTVGTEISHEVSGLRRVTILLRVESYRHDDDRFAFMAVERLRSLLGCPSAHDTLLAANVSLIECGPAQDLGNISVDDRMVSVAQAQLIFCVAATVIDPSGQTWIETVELIDSTTT